MKTKLDRLIVNPNWTSVEFDMVPTELGNYDTIIGNKTAVTQIPGTETC